MNALPLFVRVAGQPVIVLGEGEAAEAKRRLLERASAIVSGEAADARLAIVAIADDAEAEAVVTRLRERGVLVNAVDRPALCDFTLPAIVDRAPVLVAIGTGGVSAGLAKALRQRLEALLPASLGVLAKQLHAARDAIRERWPAAEDRRRAIDDGLQGPIDPLADQRADAVARWLAEPTAPEPVTEHVIAPRSTDPDDLTLREARWLARADLVLYEPGAPPALLARARADAARRPIGSAEERRGVVVIVRGIA